MRSVTHYWMQAKTHDGKPYGPKQEPFTEEQIAGKGWAFRNQSDRSIPLSLALELVNEWNKAGAGENSKQYEYRYWID